MAKRPKFGDLVELSLPNGKFAYLQYVNEHRDPPRFGSFITVFRGTYWQRPSDLEQVMTSPVLFCTFFPLAAGLRDPAMQVIANCQVPEKYREWPAFKGYNENPETEHRTWFITDAGDPARRPRKIDKLTREQVEYPTDGTINLTLLEERILGQWTEANDVRQEDVDK